MRNMFRSTRPVSGDLAGARWLIAVVLGTALLSAQGRVSSSPRGDEDVGGGRRAARNRVIVKFRDAPAPGALGQVERETDADERRGIGGRGAFVIHSRSHGATALASMLSRRADVEYAEPDYIVYQTAVPNDPFFGSQWALRNVGQTINGVAGTPGADVHAPAAWNIATGSTSTVIGITDGGFDYTAFDLAPNVWSLPVDMPVTIDGQTLTCPAGTHGFQSLGGVFNCDPVLNGGPSAHATHVAGIAGAAGNNQQGVAGVNWRASLMSLNFFGAENQGALSDGINVIEFAIQVKLRFAGVPGANVRVLNASWGGIPFSQALQDEIDRAGASDILFVTAAGNASQNLDVTPDYPASYNRPNMLVVASTNNNDQLSGFSSYGPNTVHLAAPGENILSTLPASGYGYMSGTSMATPLVAGAAALVLSRCPLDTAGVKSLLLASVDRLSQLAGKTMTGGRLNIANALQTCAAGAADAPPSVTLTSPVDGTAYTEPASIGLAASASDTDGTIARVDYYAGSTLIGTVTAPPYAATWSNVPAGIYVLVAVAVDNAGVQSSSHTVRVSVAAPGANGSLPQPWQHQDVGTVGHAGSVSESAGQFTISGAGADIWGTMDSFQFVYQPGSGDSTIVTRVLSLQNTSANAKAGVMFRASLDPSAAHVILDVEPNGSIEFMTRSTAGGSTTWLSGASRSAPVWLKLTRTGLVITGFMSTDGSTWTQVGSTATPLPANIDVGLVVTSHNTATLNMATLDSTRVASSGAAPGIPGSAAPGSGASGVSTSPTLSWASAGASSYDVAFGTSNPPPSVSTGRSAASYTPATLAHNTMYFWQIVAHNSAGSTAGPVWSFTTAAASTLPSSWQHQDIGTVGQAGSASQSAGQFTISGAGADIWGTADSFQFVYQPGSGDTTIVTRVLSLQNTSANAKAGVMFRASLDPAAAHVILDVEPNGSIEFMTRSTTGGSTAWLSGASRSAPVWLKLTRTGSVIAGYMSTDGGTWTQVGSTATPLPANIAIGMVVTSHNTATLNTATFDSTTVTSSGGAPALPGGAAPGSGASGVSTSPTLTWAASGASSYDVDLGTSNPPRSVSTGQSAASYTPATLAHSTTYFWQIVAHNGVGTTTGPVWTFTTVASAPQNIVIYAGDIPSTAMHGVWSVAGDSTSPTGIKLVTPDNGRASTGAPLPGPADYVDVVFNADAGVAYTLWLRIQSLNNDKLNDSVWVQFSDAQVNGTSIYPLNSTSGLDVNLATDTTGASDQRWGWVNGAYWLSQPATVTFAGTGTHTMRIQVREDGVEFDQIVLSPSQYFDASASCPTACTAAPGPMSNDATIVPKP
jgi:subtilisin family serine protease/regulation of enolase protein 1 (concanavalin A-like superfamily)